jgi:hypothetical protein
MPLAPDPRGCAVHPVALGIACLIGGSCWLFSFKLLSAACRAVGTMAGAGQ